MRAARAVTLSALLTMGAVALPATSGAATVPADSRCRTVEVTHSVAVHYDPNFSSRVVRTAHRGERDTVCLVAIGRGERYEACGGKGYDWYLVPGGFIPDMCARTIR